MHEEKKPVPAQRIRILHITFNMGIGGTEQVIRQLVDHLPNETFENRIVCIDGFVGEIGKALSRQGVHVEAFSREPGFDRYLIGRIRQLITSWQPHIVHCHQYTPYLYGWLAALGKRTRVIFTEHGRFYPDRYRYKAFLVNALIARFTYSLVAISKATKEALVKYECMPRSRIKVIYNGLKGLERDPIATKALRESLGIPPNAFVVGTVARLDTVKNQPMMIKAFKLALDQLEDGRLLIVGDGPEREYLEGLAKDLGIDDRVIFTGFITAPQDYLATMDLFLLSSHTEGTSMTLLEAMSLGIPSVVTDVGGNPEIVVHGKTGIVTTPGDEVAFADAMVTLGQDEEAYRSMAAESKQLFESRFSVERMVENYGQLYEDARVKLSS